ncbi:MAG TPA: ATP-binding protein [Anaeromyxobacteraceae bacterium]|nr:ATP-binding protein [Anaeromyxobacteraceae bacterium]
MTTWYRTIRVRVALSIAAVVLGAALASTAATLGTFYVHERTETLHRNRPPERQAVEDRENRAMLLRMGGAVALVLPFAIVGAAALGLWLAGRALAPMREAAERARRARQAGQARLELTLPLRGTGDEWDELAGVMNGLLEEQRGSIAREKAFSANAAHELRTPLAAMLGEIQVTLRRERTTPEYRASLAIVEEEVSRLAALVDALLTLARADAGRLGACSAPFDLAEAARSAVERARRVGRARAALLVDPAVPAGAAVVGDPLLTGRILDNLVDNALRHASSRVMVRVALRRGHGVAVVEDDGPGPSPEARSRLFERFNKPVPGEGFGLGLAIARALACAQRGTLDLHSGAGSTAFRLELPLAEASAGATVSSAFGAAMRRDD